MGRAWWALALAVMLLVGLGVERTEPSAAVAPVKIGALTSSWGPNPQIAGLREGLATLGFRENEHFVIAVRFTQGDVRALAPAARDLVKLGSDILFPSGGDEVAAAQAATSSIPIVFAGAGDDPVRRGLVKSIARPGGNITGVVDLGVELAGKRLELFRELVPGLKRVAVPYAVGDRYVALEIQALREAARQLGMILLEKGVPYDEDAQAALAAVRRPDVQGVLLPHGIARNLPRLAFDVAMKQGIPTMFPASFFVLEGGLASYGPDYHETGRQAARLVAKIIRGEKPAQIPVESNPKIEFTLNLKTAKQLGLSIPAAVLARADRVLE